MTVVTYLTPTEVGEMLQVSSKTISRWALEDPTMPVIRLPGRVVRYELEALNRWLRAQGRRRSGARGTEVPTSVEQST